MNLRPSRLPPLLTADQLKKCHADDTQLPLLRSGGMLIGPVTVCGKMVSFLNQQRKTEELMWSSHKSAHSCLDMSIDSALYTDPHPAVKILLIFCEKNYDFSNICLGEKSGTLCFFFSYNKDETEALMNVWADLYFASPCRSVSPSVLTSLWTEYMAAHQGWELWAYRR